MAHKTRINGTNYSITGGKTKVGGTNYSVKGGKTLVGGTVRTISFGPELVEFCIFDGYMVPMECFFTAEVGMTWKDWINSDYVTPNDWGVTNGDFEIRNNLVYVNGTQIQYFNGNTMEYDNVYAADIISDFESGAAGIWFDAVRDPSGGDSGGGTGGGDTPTGNSYFILKHYDISSGLFLNTDKYYFDAGMTWQTFIDSSKYSSYGFSYIKAGSGWAIDRVYDWDGCVVCEFGGAPTPVCLSETIVNGEEYYADDTMC